MFNYRNQSRKVQEINELENSIQLLIDSTDNLYQEIFLDVESQNLNRIFHSAKLIKRLGEFCFQRRTLELSYEDLIASSQNSYCDENLRRTENLRKAVIVLLNLARRLKAELKIPFSKNSDSREFLLRMIKLINPIKDLEDLLVAKMTISNNVNKYKNENSRYYFKVRQFSQS
jgi:hypothetical protein